jgi:hypothetical protein
VEEEVVVVVVVAVVVASSRYIFCPAPKMEPISTSSMLI